MTQIEGVTLASRSDWTVLRPLLFESIGQTLEMVLVTMIRLEQRLLCAAFR